VKHQIAALFGCAAFCATALVQSPAETELYKKLADGPDQVKALETVLKAPDAYSPVILYSAAAAALKEKRIEDCGFLFYAAQLRARFDKECFPPKGKGGDSPFVLYSALSQQLGSAINPTVMGEPKAFAKAIERLKKWNPKAPKDYNPGYDFTERKPEKDAHDAVKPGRTEFIAGMSDFSTLLNDAEYFAAFRVIQAYNRPGNEKRPTKEEKEKATETMKRIEKEKGLKGFFSK
jgi:hypothetical protein